MPYIAWLKSVQFAVNGYPGVLGPERSHAHTPRILSFRLRKAIGCQ
jgi:hypothetical protein